MSAGMHFGRSWTGHDIEDTCPCHKAPCGLVDVASDDCNQHAWKYARTMRQGHDADHCPAPSGEAAEPTTTNRGK